MTSLAPFPPQIVAAADTKVLSAFGDQATFLVTGEETAGAFSVFINVTEPGGGPPPHWHEDEDEYFFVLEGKAEFLKEGEWIEAGAGSAVLMPRGSIHSFRNVGDTPLRQLIKTSPAGFETFFARCSVEFQREGGPDMARF